MFWRHFFRGYVTKLRNVDDDEVIAPVGGDIKDQDNDNYNCDEIGNLTMNKIEGITTAITWSVYGKILKSTATEVANISYTYDASGNRISKTVNSSTKGITNTFYVRDATGNVMSMYGTESGVNNANITQNDVPHKARPDLHIQSRLIDVPQVHRVPALLHLM